MYYDKRTTTRMKKISSRILFMFMLLLVMVPAGFAQDKTSTTKNETESQEVFIENRVAELEAKLQSVKEQIDEVKQPETESVRLQYGISEDELNKYAQLLEETEAVIQQQITAIKKQASLQQLQKRMENVLSSPQNLAVPLLPPYSLSVLDEYLDEQEAQNLLDETAELAREVAQKNLEDAQLNYDKAEQNLRKIKEDADAQVGKENQVVYEFTKIVAQLEFDLAEAALNLNQVYLQNAETEVNLNKQQSSILKNQTELIRDNLEYDEEDLQEKLKNTETIRQQHNERIQSLASEQQEVEAKWLKAQEQFDSIKDRDENTKLIAKAWLDEREAWKNTYQQALVQTENIFRLLSYGDEIWHRRYALLQGNYNPNQLVEWLQELKSSQKNIDRLSSLVSSAQNNLPAQILALQVTLSQKKDSLPAEAINHMLSQLKAMEKLSANNLEYISKLQIIKKFESRYIDEIHEKRKNIRFIDLVKGVALEMNKKLEFELYVIDDQSITIRKIILALFILFVGLFLAKLFSRFVMNRLMAKTQLDESAKAAIHKVTFFILTIILVLYALHTVNIPLTILALLGGAVAIGVGFGSQNLINNFISGFILMFERPIKIDDVIEIDNIIGRVQHIGTRCTQIRTQANLNILVPNSSLLEKNIINWTLSDDVVRCNISVGVAYGSSTRDTVKALERAVEEHELILKKPEPIIVFKDFGDNALIFEVYFWIRLGKGRMVKIQTESNVRFLIEKHLREADIVVAFPQRDVHMDTSKPLDLRIINVDKNDVSNTAR
ncbi:MAG: mechanosensitive ion channel [Desulfobulbaceae bacterium]|jgi:small-conductance mechanosensitive channel|nr:mechanosensitive ion channel [Desulfobulbaceae bacterium]